MKDFDYRRIDFTQLAILASLLRTRKATETANKLGMTQSTVSHALSRLRETFGDELFVRRSHGLEPTARARELEPILDSMFGLARQMIETPEFRPQDASGVVRIGAADIHCALMAPILMASFAEQAPNLQVSFRPLIRRAAIEALAGGEIDFAVGRFWRLPASLTSALLFVENYSVVARAGHPVVRSDPTLEEYLAARHIVVSLQGDLRGIVDAALESSGKSRSVVMSVPYFLASLATAAVTDCLVTLPTRMARAYADRFGLRVLKAPLEIADFEVRAVYPASVADSARTKWLLQVFREHARVPA